MPKQVRHDGDGSVVTLNNILSHQSTACCLYQHPPALKNLFVTLNNRLLPSITLPVTLNLFQGLFIIVTLNLFGGLPPILGAFYNATTFKMPKQVRHDRSVVTLNNILSRQSTACCHCTLHTCAKLVFSIRGTSHVRKKLRFGNYIIPIPLGNFVARRSSTVTF